MSKPLTFLLLSAFALGGCKKTDKPEAVAPTASQDKPTATKDQDDGKATVFVAEEVLEVCELPTEYFAFDSAKLTPADKEMLDELTACFVSGKAKDRSMNLVGHADPRGEEDYNFALGQRRADRVGTYIREHGLSADRLQTSSRGALDAKGTDEDTWAEDRRVDILFAN